MHGWPDEFSRREHSCVVSTPIEKQDPGAPFVSSPRLFPAPSQSPDLAQIHFYINGIIQYVLDNLTMCTHFYSAYFTECSVFSGLKKAFTAPKSYSFLTSWAGPSSPHPGITGWRRVNWAFLFRWAASRKLPVEVWTGYFYWQERRDAWCRFGGLLHRLYVSCWDVRASRSSVSIYQVLLVWTAGCRTPESRDHHSAVRILFIINL